MLFHCEDENCENELRRQEHLDDWNNLAFRKSKYSFHDLHSPRTIDVPDPSVVETFSAPGNSPLTTPEAAMAPRS